MNKIASVLSAASRDGSAVSAPAVTNRFINGSLKTFSGAQANRVVQVAGPVQQSAANMGCPQVIAFLSPIRRQREHA